MSMVDVNMKINKYMGIGFQQQGFALIEVLISGFGYFGIAGNTAAFGG